MPCLSRNPFAHIVGIALWLVAGLLRAEADRPNILIILADDLGYETVGAYGGNDFATPELDRMAENGLRFSRAYTSPVCTPTRVSLHTGLYTADHGHTGVLPVHRGTAAQVDFQAMPTFAQRLQSAGYQTSTTGKWQLATLVHFPDHIADAGFDSWCVWQIWSGTEKTTRYYDPYFNRDGQILDSISDRFGPDVLRDYVSERMRTARDAGEPFLIVHNMLLPHFPIVETPDGGGASLKNMIGYMDKLVGDLLDDIDALGIRDNTYVFFIGDNGTDTGTPRTTDRGSVSGGKRDLTDAGTRVPFIVWGPPSVPVGVDDGLVDITDMFPTVCSLAGVEIPDTIPYRGTNLQPRLAGREGRPRRWVHQGISGEDSVFDGQWRLTTDGTLINAANLPVETVVTTPTTESESARDRLQRILDFITGAATAEGGVIVDNDDASRVTITGEWKSSANASGFIGSDYLHNLNTDQGAKQVHYTFTAPSADTYTVELRWTDNANRATNVPVEVSTPDGSTTVTIDQTRRGSTWNRLSTVELAAGESAVVTIRTAGTDGYVIADAVRFVPQTELERAAWLQLNFPASTLQDSGAEDSIWGSAADPDGDGLVNAIEFFLGTNPLKASSHSRGGKITWNSDVKKVQATVRRGSAHLEFATSLGDDWTASDAMFDVTAVTPVDRFHDTLTYTYTADGAPPRSLFLRIAGP